MKFQEADDNPAAPPGSARLELPTRKCILIFFDTSRVLYY